MKNKKYFECEGFRIERSGSDGMIVKDRYTKEKIIEIPKGLRKLI